MMDSCMKSQLRQLPLSVQHLRVETYVRAVLFDKALAIIKRTVKDMHISLLFLIVIYNFGAKVKRFDDKGSDIIGIIQRDEEKMKKTVYQFEKSCTFVPNNLR